MNIAFEKIDGEDKEKSGQVVYILFQHILVRFIVFSGLNNLEPKTDVFS